MTLNEQGFQVPDAYTSCVLLVSFNCQEKQFQLVMHNIEDDITTCKFELPEDYVKADEMANQRGIAIVENSIGLSSKSMFIRHIGVYDHPTRDSRGWFITNVFYAVVEQPILDNLTNNSNFQVISESKLIEAQDLVAWDHFNIISKIMENIKNDIYTQLFNKTLFESDIISEIFGKEFSAGDLQTIGEAVGLKYDRTSYYRNINKYYKKSRVVKIDGIKKPVTLYKKGN